MAARLVEQRLNADRSDSHAAHRCSCGAWARFVDRRTKVLLTALGEIRFERAYFHCAKCQRGFCPRDAALGVSGTSLSPHVLRMVGAVAALVSFEESAALLHELADLTIHPKHVERSAEALGSEIAQEEQRFVEPPTDDELPPTLYLGMDGTGIPMRKEELVGHSGKQEDGTAKTREVKLCTIFSAEARDAEGIPVRDEGSITYSAAIESAANDERGSPSVFGQRVDREARRRGFNRAARRVVLGDGAAWIWNLAEERFPGAIQILDRFHAKEHLSDVAKAIFGPTNALAHPWAEARCAELDAGAINQILAALTAHRDDVPEADRCHDYIENNRKRMNYPWFRAQGLCTSTGVVESGCKRVVGTRLKCAGMHWTVRGANAIIALRACRLSNRFEDFWDRRRRQIAAR